MSTFNNPQQTWNQRFAAELVAAPPLTVLIAQIDQGGGVSCAEAHAAKGMDPPTLGMARRHRCSPTNPPRNLPQGGLLSLGLVQPGKIGGLACSAAARDCPFSRSKPALAAAGSVRVAGSAAARAVDRTAHG